jgi:hypothetical protein
MKSDITLPAIRTPGTRTGAGRLTRLHGRAAGDLQPLGEEGQIYAVVANVRYPDTVARAVTSAEVVVNSAGILTEQGRQAFEAVHVAGARAIARSAREAGVRSLVHVSGDHSSTRDGQSDAFFNAMPPMSALSPHAAAAAVMLGHSSSSRGGGPTRLTVQLGGSLQGNDSSRASSTFSRTSALILLPLAERRRGFLPAPEDLGRG